MQKKYFYFVFIVSLFIFSESRLDAQSKVYELNAVNFTSGSTRELSEFSATNPRGVKLNVNSRYFEKNGKPWFPLMGEFHYWRFPAEYWEEQLLKMKSAGLSIVSTYVYWGAHEKPKGLWNWSGRLDLRYFIELCAKHGLYVWLRPGPYINGDVRGRGFPDWIYTMAGKRSNKPEYLAEVGNYFNQVGKQTKGLYWKEGGPIIGVQLENEYASGDRTHINRLKTLAMKAGIAPVYWSVTANTVFQDDKFEVIPLQGAYCYRGWEKEHNLTTDFLFAEDQWIMDANFGRLYYDVDKYPRGTCEQGAGMQETHDARFIVEPQVIEAHAQNQLGRGINMIGYFMFQGGTQYPGTEMPESDGPYMPSGLVSYDYQAPLDEFGKMADSYKYLKMLHTFLNDFGNRIVKTDVFRPQNLPVKPEDLEDLRYVGRFNNQGEGFVFICNTQNYRKMTEKELQIKLNLPKETLVFPRNPVTIEDSKIATWPVNFVFNDVNIKYATAQILCKISAKNEDNLFMYETEGIPGEICIQKNGIKLIDTKNWNVDDKNGSLFLLPNKLPASFIVKKADGKKIRITMLARKDAENAWKVSYKNQEHLFITQAGLLVYPDKIIAHQINNPQFTYRVFPDLKFVNAQKEKVDDGIFSSYQMQVKKEEMLGKVTSSDDLTDVISIAKKLPAHVSDIIANVKYQGDLGIATLNGVRVADRLYYGKDWNLGLKRFLKEMTAPENKPMTIKITGQYSDKKPKIESINLVPEYEIVLK